MKFQNKYSDDYNKGEHSIRGTRNDLHRIIICLICTQQPNKKTIQVLFIISHI